MCLMQNCRQNKKKKSMVNYDHSALEEAITELREEILKDLAESIPTDSFYESYADHKEN